MLDFMKFMFEFCLRIMRFRSIKKYRYQVIVDQILSRLNKLHNTNEYNFLEYPMRLSGNFSAEYYNRTTGKTLISFSSRENGVAFIENFDVSCLDFLKDHVCYIARYSRINNFHSFARFNNGKVTGFCFVITINSNLNPRKDNNYIELTITTDDQFCPVGIVRKLCIASPVAVISRHLIKNNVSFEDELQLIKLKVQSQNPEINHLVPEINTPSAYDFNSEDLKSRLLMVEMMEC